MSKDHFIAQTYLKHFVNSEGYLYPFRKNQTKTVGKASLPKSICYEIDGDKNPYFEDEKALDKYLPYYENNWNGAINKLENGQIDSVTKQIISGYLAFLRTCTPTAKRLGEGSLQPLADYLVKKTIDCKHDLIRAKSVVEAEVDRNYAHALGIQSINNCLQRFYCAPWVTVIIESEFEFVTTDNPVVFAEETAKPVFFVPVKPRLGILIALRDRSDKLPKEFYDDYGNRNSDERTIINPHKVKLLNKQLIQSAEKTILYHSDESWVEQLVVKYSNWRVESVNSKILTSDGKHIFISSQRRRECS